MIHIAREQGRAEDVTVARAERLLVSPSVFALLCIPLCLPLCLLMVSAAHAEPLLLRNGLASVTVVEMSGEMVVHSFDADAPELQERATELTAEGADFVGTMDEVYDLYVSNREGGVEVAGEYLTIRGRYDYPGPAAGSGFNIAAVFLTLNDGTRIYPTLVTRTQTGEHDPIPLSAMYAVDKSLVTYTSFGRGGAMSITIGFPAPAAPSAASVTTRSIRGRIRGEISPATFVPEPLVAAIPPEGIAVCDLDGDGKEELLTLGAGGSRFDLIRPGVPPAAAGEEPQSSALAIEPPSTAVICARIAGDGRPVPLLWSAGRGELREVIVGADGALALRVLPATGAGVALERYRSPPGSPDRLVVWRAGRRRFAISRAPGDGGAWNEVVLPFDIGVPAVSVPIDALGTGWQGMLLLDSKAKRAAMLYLEQELEVSSKPRLLFQEAGQRIDWRLFDGVRAPVAGMRRRHSEEQLYYPTTYRTLSAKYPNGSFRDDERHFADLLGVPERMLAGDLDGDGSSDLLLKLEKAKYWLLVRNSDGFEETTTVLADGAEGMMDASVRPLDADGDGMDDVVGYDQNEKRWRLFRSTLAGPLAAASVEVDGIVRTTTGEDGRFQVEGTRREFRTVRVHADGFETVERSVADGAELDLVLRHRPSGICTGYVPEVGSERARTRWLSEVGMCPEGYAIFAVDDVSRQASLGRQAGPITCCRLPHADVLTGGHESALRLCPEGTVFTGYEDPGNSGRLRCARLNTEKYVLGPPRPGKYWGYGFSICSSNEQLRKSAIPPALRYALGRLRRRAWDVDGCVGSPPGSLLVGENGSGCEGLQFRELHYKSAAGGIGEQVQIFPSCPAIESPFSPTPECRR